MPAKIPQDWRRFESLVEIVAHLRGPDGCPWDKEQTHQSLVPFAIEEVFEIVEAIEKKDSDPTEHEFKEELGDLLFQVVLHSQLAEERKVFNIYDVLATLNEKMVRRHPHVFGDEILDTPEKVLANWEVVKKQEKVDKKKAKALNFELPPQLPALQKADKIGKKTEKLNFDWTHAADVMIKVKEELGELEDAIQHESVQRQEEELGDLLFAISQLARHLHIEPETALRKANNKFETRFFKMLNLAETQNLDFQNLPSEEKEKLWQAIKK